jgi:hypothetical protein
MGSMRRPRPSRPSAEDAGGAVQLLTLLSKDYGEIEAYADALLILREDCAIRRCGAGAKWKAVLTRALEQCFASVPQAPTGIGLLMAAQWQGSVLCGASIRRAGSKTMSRTICNISCPRSPAPGKQSRLRRASAHDAQACDPRRD